MSYPLIKPRFLYRITDDRTYTNLDDHGNFDVGCHAVLSLGFRINTLELNRHRDWSHRFDKEDPNNFPRFVSTTDDENWAFREYQRRRSNFHENVHLFRIDLSNYYVTDLALDASHSIEVLRHHGTGAMLFSTQAATEALPNWSDPKKQASEWFALEWIPQEVIQRIS